jgi:uncharacterized protein (UPF0548 family)
MTKFELLDPATEARLRAAPFTYSEVGRTVGIAPSGYTVLSRSLTLDTRDFEATSEALMHWQVQQRAGVVVLASSTRIRGDSVVLLRLGIGRIGIPAPCRVVHIVDEPDRQGFAYGTLPGHPESGEESFVVSRGADGRITFTITAFSRPASLLTKLGGPVSRGVQRAITRRYLRTLNN